MNTKLDQAFLNRTQALEARDFIIFIRLVIVCCIHNLQIYQPFTSVYQHLRDVHVIMCLKPEKTIQLTCIKASLRC